MMAENGPQNFYLIDWENVHLSNRKGTNGRHAKYKSMDKITCKKDTIDPIRS